LKLLLALILASAVPSAPSKTAWMRLETFGLSVGMQRDAAIDAIKQWQPKKGASADEIVVDYGNDKALTITFANGRVQSVRFELFTMLVETRRAFEEQRAYLRETRGAPRKALPTALIYDNALPNVMVVITDDPNSEQGKKGLGVLAVRYYDPR
jgi:hypothetical protein